MLWLILIILVVMLIVFILHRKKLILGSLNIVSGGLKTGKTMLCVWLSWKDYQKALREWRKACRKAQHKFEPLPEKPLYYTNMPVAWEYAPLTEELMTREKRFRYGSVVYFNEISLVAGQMDYGDNDLNDNYKHLWKLFAHELKSPTGRVYLDTQTGCQDVHYEIKNACSTQIRIIRNIHLPLFDLLILRQEQVMNGSNTIAINPQIDPQDTVAEGGQKNYWYLVPHIVWKWYDRYAYSSLTDGLPVEDTTVIPEEPCDMKVKKDRMLRTRNIIARLKENRKKKKEVV